MLWIIPYVHTILILLLKFASEEEMLKLVSPCRKHGTQIFNWCYTLKFAVRLMELKAEIAQSV
jgi:hypothetical protein